MQNTLPHWTPDTLLALPYCAEQQAVINAALAKIVADRSGFCEYSHSERFAFRGEQAFAVFGTVARELLRFSDAEDDRGRWEYLPVVIDGRMIECAPDEGQSGLLYLMRCTKRRGHPHTGAWTYGYLGNSWLYTDELTLSNEQISDNIARSLDFSTPTAWL